MGVPPKGIPMAMLLKSDDGAEFELALIADPLHDIQDGFGDATALTMSFRVARGDESWEETAPCLNTFEVQQLAQWLAAVAEGPTAVGEIAEVELPEPELRFAVLRDRGESVVLRVSFHLDEVAPELNLGAETDEASHIDLKLGRSALRIAAAELRRDLEELEDGTQDDLDGDRAEGLVRAPDHEGEPDMVDDHPSPADEAAAAEADGADETEPDRR